MATTKFCQGISDISDTYMGFIIDQWGVLHDGQKLYDGVLECMEELRGRKKKVIILSNSTHPGTYNEKALKKMGLGPDFYDHIVTSGELIRNGLEQQSDGLFKGYGKKCFIFGEEEAKGIFDGTDIEIVNDIKDASFMLIAGIDRKMLQVDDYLPILKEAVRRGIKAICTNPDSHALLGANYLMGPALISRSFEDFGGVVQYIGKPHAPIFKKCITLLQKEDVFPAQTVMIGDTMAHDIMGAHYVNVDTCLVKTGMHAGVFKNNQTPAEVDKTLDILITHYNHIRPRYLVGHFEWGNALPDRKHKIHKKHVRRKPVETEADKVEKLKDKTEEKTSEKKKIRKKPTPRQVKS